MDDGDGDVSIYTFYNEHDDPLFNHSHFNWSVEIWIQTEKKIYLFSLSLIFAIVGVVPMKGQGIHNDQCGAGQDIYDLKGPVQGWLKRTGP